ncbi:MULTISPECIES: hypothetical protein [Streptococcus]|jgi:hypothetical protein|uniref:hypothetical protein n=1 Tax=Streptococcus TaxID=1301 RepID=UPI000784FC9A|nr:MULTISPECIES: hypothetical protein [Streptococcus]KAF1307566.1 hypothetical protein I925_00085 [Streptococcus sanguinis OH0843]
MFDLIKQWSTNPFFVFFSLFALVVLVALIYISIEKMILNSFTKLDNKKNYNSNSLAKKIKLREDRERNYVYYGIDYWIWQKNKLQILESLFPVGMELSNGKVIDDVLHFSKVTPKIFGGGTRETRYLRELRFIPKNVPKTISTFGDFINGDKIGGDKFENHRGVQNIQITKNQILQPLEQLLLDGQLSDGDSMKIKQFIYNLSNDNSSEDEKTNIIEILGNYIGLVSGIAGIIDVLHNFQIF